MGRKRRKRKAIEALRQLANHEQHHAAIHEYIIHRKMVDEGIPQHHSIPIHQNWHVPDPTCACFPSRIGIADAQTGAEVWQHKGWIH